MSFRKIVAGLFALVLVVFVAGNFETSRVWFVGVRLEMPLAFVMLGSAALGAGCALAWTLLRGGRAKKA